MSSTFLRNFFVLQIQATAKNYGFIYERVDLCRLEKAILTASYKLTPFWVKRELRGFPFKMDSLVFFRFDTVTDARGLLEFYLCLKLEDELILISLAKTLERYVLTPNVFLEQSFACRTEKKAIHFLAEIKNWSNLRALFVLDFSIFSKVLCRKRLVAKMKPLIEDQFILHLIDSFLHCPIKDKQGRNLNEGIPGVQFIFPVLLNFFLDDMDRKFVSKFPDWTFARFYHQMLIPIGTGCKKEDLLFIQNAFIDDGVKLEILRPGDGKAVFCRSGRLFLNQYGRIEWIPKG